MTERELLKTLSVNIKFYRSRFRWSQAELAEKLGISINFLSDIETAKKWPSPTTIVKMADAFELEAYELLKPECVLPDNYHAIIEKYSENIAKAVETVRQEFLTRLN